MFPPQHVAPVNGPIRHTPGLEEFFLKMLIFQHMKKNDGCAFGCTYLGVGRESNEELHHTFIPYKYWRLTLRQKKVMIFQNKVPECCFWGCFPLKPWILQH